MTNWTDSKEHARQMHQILNLAWWNAYCFRPPKTFVRGGSIESDCATCREYSVFGGPRHEASANCRSGKHDHCSCDFCW